MSSAPTPSDWHPAEWTNDARMRYLISDVGEDPDVRDTKTGFWSDTFLAWQRAVHARRKQEHGSASAASASSAVHSATQASVASTARAAAPALATLPPLSFSLAEAESALSWKGTVSAPLELSLCGLLQSDQIRRADKYAAPASTSGVKGAGAKMAGLLWSWVSPSKPLTRLPGANTGARFVLVELVAQAARDLSATLASQSTDVFTLDDLVALSCRQASDVLLLIEHLRTAGMNPQLIEALPAKEAPSDVRVWKFAAPTSAPPTSIDHQRALMSSAIRTLKSQAALKEEYIAARDKEARRLLVAKRRPLALLQLRMKSRAIASLHSLHAQLDNLDLVSSHLEQAVTSSQCARALTKASRELQAVQRTMHLDPDHIRDVADELAEQMEAVGIVDQALAEPSQCTGHAHACVCAVLPPDRSLVSLLTAVVLCVGVRSGRPRFSGCGCRVRGVARRSGARGGQNQKQQRAENRDRGSDNQHQQQRRHRRSSQRHAGQCRCHSPHCACVGHVSHVGQIIRVEGVSRCIVYVAYTRFAFV